jgi:hypothetical protein
MSKAKSTHATRLMQEIVAVINAVKELRETVEEAEDNLYADIERGIQDSDIEAVLSSALGGADGYKAILASASEFVKFCYTKPDECEPSPIGLLRRVRL